METLSRLEQLKLARKRFPLTAYLEIVYKSPYDCYVNHLEGAKLLHEWLTNNGEVPLLDNYPKQPMPSHPLLHTYYQNKLTAVITGTEYGPAYARVFAVVFSFSLEHHYEHKRL